VASRKHSPVNETETDTDRQTNGQRVTQANIQTGRQTYGHTERQTYGQRDRQTEPDKHAATRACSMHDRQTDGRTDTLQHSMRPTMGGHPSCGMQVDTVPTTTMRHAIDSPLPRMEHTSPASPRPLPATSEGGHHH